MHTMEPWARVALRLRAESAAGLGVRLLRRSCVAWSRARLTGPSMGLQKAAAKVSPAVRLLSGLQTKRQGKRPMFRTVPSR